MRTLFFYHIAVVVLCSLATNPLQSPRKAPSIKIQRAQHNELLKKIVAPETIANLTCNGQHFVPEFLLGSLTFYVENPTAYLSKKELLKLIERIKAFYEEQKKSLAYNPYILKNPDAPTIVFNGEDIPATFQFGQAFCLSIVMLNFLICTSALYSKTVAEVFNELEKITLEETKHYDDHNSKSGFVASACEIARDHILDDYTTSSTEASEDEDTEEKDSAD